MKSTDVVIVADVSWASIATLRLVRCDMARAAAGIPSFLD